MQLSSPHLVLFICGCSAIYPLLENLLQSLPQLKQHIECVGWPPTKHKIFGETSKIYWLILVLDISRVKIDSLWTFMKILEQVKKIEWKFVSTRIELKISHWLHLRRRTPLTNRPYIKWACHPASISFFQMTRDSLIDIRPTANQSLVLSAEDVRMLPKMKLVSQSAKGWDVLINHRHPSFVKHSRINNCYATSIK